MKKIISCLFILISWLQANSQQIGGISIFPTSPSVADTIEIQCLVGYSSLPCYQTSDSLIINGNIIIGQARHCVGTLIGNCGAVDTFIITNLSAGNYWFYYWPGFTVTCNWGGSPYPDIIDSILIHVSNPDGVQTPSGFSFVKEIIVYNLTGQLVYDANSEREFSSFKESANGFFIIKKIMSDQSFKTEKLLKIKN